MKSQICAVIETMGMSECRWRGGKRESVQPLMKVSTAVDHDRCHRAHNDRNRMHRTLR